MSFAVFTRCARPAALLLVAGLLTFAAGCTPAVPTISGKVTANGEAPKADSISLSFSPADGQRGTAITLEPDGTYSGNAVAGVNKVTLVIYGDVAASGVAKKYTSEGTTTLTVDVKPGANTQDFEVGK